MNEKQYRQISEACDDVLLSPDANMETTAIPWLHVIREHPFILEQYQSLFEPPALSIAIKKYLRQVRNTLGWFRQIWRALISRGEAWKASRPLNDQVDVLFVSHLLSNEDAGKINDFYFGSLPELLEASGRRVVIALINHSSRPNISIVERWDSSMTTRVLLSSTLGFKDEWLLYCRLRSEAKRLAKFARQLKSGLLQRVYSHSSLEAMTGGTRSALRISKQVGRLVATIKPKMIMVTYEGHSWERIAFSAAREALPGIKCIGYQHAAIFRLQYAALRKLQSQFNPKTIFTSGVVSERRLKNLSTLQDTAIHTLGSIRSSDNGRFVSRKDVKDCCIVLPEGIMSECISLFNFSLKCALRLPSVNFILRLHPSITFSKLGNKWPQVFKLPKNIEFSSKPLEHDICRANMALYRGSTAIIQAARSGLLPIYLDISGEMSIDPLFEVSNGVIRIDNVDDFLGIANQQSSLKVNSTIDSELAKYCKDFYTPFDLSVISSQFNEDGYI